MSITLPGNAIPGAAIPGEMDPGLPASPAGQYEYIGYMTCYYLDYLDLTTGRVLSPSPGGFYNMMVASGRASFLTVPPPGRPWNPGDPGGGGTYAPEVTFRRHTIPVPVAVSHGHYPGTACLHCDPEPRAAAPRTSAPPHPGADPAADMARGRAHTAALQVAWARGDVKPGDPLSPEAHARLGCCQAA